MNRIAPIAALALGATALTSCTTMHGTMASFASVAQVVNEIQCQLWRAIASAGAQTLWSGYRAKLALTVTVVNSVGFDAGGYGYFGGIEIGGDYDQDRSMYQVVRVPEVSFNLSELAALDCSTPPAFTIANMSGGGIFGSLFAFAGGAGGGGVGRLSDTFSVATTFSLYHYSSVGFDLAVPGDLEIGVNRNRSDVHTAIVAFTRNTAGADARLNEAIDLQEERTDDYYVGSSSRSL
jgi:hypothetical protein